MQPIDPKLVITADPKGYFGAARAGILRPRLYNRKFEKNIAIYIRLKINIIPRGKISKGS